MLSKVPRVSEILDLMPWCKVEAGFIGEEGLSLKARFGTAAHRMFGKVAEKSGDWSAVEKMLGRIPSSPLRDHADAVYRFLRDTGAKPIHIEQRITTKEFTGQPDLICGLTPAEFWLIDFKTGKMMRPRHEVQLAAYSMLAEAYWRIAVGRASVVEISAGRYKVRDVAATDIERHKKAFLAACELWHWQKSQN